jgi:hypothetical protein
MQGRDRSRRRAQTTSTLSKKIHTKRARTRAPIARRSAETANGRLADNARRRKILKADAIENLLAGRQAVVFGEQHQ